MQFNLIVVLIYLKTCVKDCVDSSARLLEKGISLPPQGFRPEGEIPRRHPSNSRILREVLTVEIYSSHTVSIEKILICLNTGREESVGNGDVSIVCARKYEMVPQGTA